MIVRLSGVLLLSMGMAVAVDSGSVAPSAANHWNDEAFYELYIREAIAEPEKHPDVGWMFYSRTDTPEDGQRRAADAQKLRWQTKVEGPKYKKLEPGPARIVVERIGEDKKNKVFRDKLYFNGNYLGTLLENRDMMIPPSPAGKPYAATIRTRSAKNYVQSPKGLLSTSGDFLLEVGNLPDRWTDILLHPGTKQADSLGCILGGKTAKADPPSKENATVAPEVLRELRLFYFRTDTPEKSFVGDARVHIRGHPNALDTDKLRRQLVRHEGNRPKVEYVEVDGTKIPRIGIGFDLRRADARAKLEAMRLNYDAVVAGEQSLSVLQIQTLFAADLGSAIADVRSRFADFDKFPELRKRAVVDIMYAMGPARFDGLAGTVAALKERDFEKAATALKASEWYKKVGVRGATLYNMLEGDSDFAE